MDVHKKAQETLLRAQLKQTLERYQKARTKFDDVMQEAKLIGLDHPDGSHAAHKAAVEFNKALREYGLALKRLGDFSAANKPETTDIQRPS